MLYKIKNTSLFLILAICLFSCKEKGSSTTLSPEEKAKNEKIRNHFVVVVGELDKFMDAEKLHKGADFKDNYTTTLPYALTYINQMKKVGFTEYSDVDYRNAFSYALSHAVKNQDSWKELTYIIASKRHKSITDYNTENQKNVDSLAYFQAGVAIISNEVYASGVDISGITQLQQILEKAGIEEQYRTPINILD